MRASSSSAFAAGPRWSGATAPGNALAVFGSWAAAKASARTTSDVDLIVAAYVAGQDVPLSQDERNAALRRALFVFAAGGDLSRDPTLDDPAVRELAADLDSPQRRDALAAAIDRLDAAPEALRDRQLAWRAYACGLLADALGED